MICSKSMPTSAKISPEACPERPNLGWVWQEVGMTLSRVGRETMLLGCIRRKGQP